MSRLETFHEARFVARWKPRDAIVVFEAYCKDRSGSWWQTTPR